MSRPLLTLAAGLALAATALLAGCERPPVDTVQRGFRGTGMEQVYNPRTLAAQADLNTSPEAAPPASADGPKAGQIYQNVKVLGDLSVAQFARTMVAITAWVAPAEGCAYCHNAANFADEGKYTKVVARRMLQMTQHVNSDWKTHVAATGVTCYTCHRGQPVPSQVWFGPTPPEEGGLAGNKAGQNTPLPVVNMSSLPNDPFTPFLLQGQEIRVIGESALPDGNRHSVKQTEWTYGLMTHMSQSLGVNCTFCHNTRSFAAWDASTPQRATAWYGIRMARDLNNAYLTPLTGTFPAGRLGPAGDVAKVNCATCHQGAYKPLYGVSLLAAHPELAGPGQPNAASASAAVLGKILFEVGKTDLSADALQVVAGAVASLKGDDSLHIALSGFTDKTGNADSNLELAKQRAMAVRDALTAAGAPEDRVELRKPEFAEAGGTEADARRVDLIAAR